MVKQVKDDIDADLPPELVVEGAPDVVEDKKPKAAKAKSEKVTIVIDEPADGSLQHFFGLNGKGFLIRFGEAVTVPRGLLNVIDEAVQTKTIPLQDGGFTERNFKRFSYRVVN